MISINGMEIKCFNLFHGKLCQDIRIINDLQIGLYKININSSSLKRWEEIFMSESDLYQIKFILELSENLQLELLILV